MRPQLFLHAGFHKTGTSSIQRSAASHRRLLAEQGLLYPRLWPASFRPVDGHHFIAHAVAGNERFITRSQASRLVGRWHRAAKKSGMAVMLSSEALCRLAIPGAEELVVRQEAYLEKVAELLAGFDITPVLVVRRQDDFVRSLYQEHVLQGRGATARMDFSEYLLHSAADKPRFLERLRLFRSVFGNVRLLVYERLCSEGLLSAFYSELGFDVEGSLRLPAAVRSSPGAGETLLKRKLNHWVKNERQNDRLLKWMQTRSVREAIRRLFPATVSLWPDCDSRLRFLRRFDEENGCILTEFAGDRWHRLFPGHKPELRETGTMRPSEVDEAIGRIVCGQRAKLERILGVEAVASLKIGKCKRH